LGFADQLAKVREVLSLLRPTQTSEATSTGFTPIDGLLAIEEEPPTRDRVCDVMALDVGTTQGAWARDFRQAQKSFAVVVRYDAGADLASLEGRMAEDEEQIVDALESPENFASGVQLVVCTGGAIDRAIPRFPLATLTFRCLYALT
jgi:hypothetical protein